MKLQTVDLKIIVFVVAALHLTKQQNKVDKESGYSCPSALERNDDTNTLPCCTLTKSKLPCLPCPAEQWFDMLFNYSSTAEADTNTTKPNKCGPETEGGITLKMAKKLTDDNESCYNRNPMLLPERHRETKTKGGDSDVISELTPDLDPFISAAGFTLPRHPFFRLPLESSDPVNLDIGNVQRYYKDTDFEILEWPGRTFKDQIMNVQDRTEAIYYKDNKKELKCYKSIKTHGKDCLDTFLDMKIKGCPASNCSGCLKFFEGFGDENIYKRCKRRVEFSHLIFARNFAKIRFYPCNNVEGTSITALALVSINGSSDKESPKVYVSGGQLSIDREYIHGVLVSHKVLVKMGQNYDPDKDCYYNERTEFDDEDEIDDLLLVYDFEFTRDRLIIGMKCGVLLVKRLLNPPFVISEAKLWSLENKTDRFPLPIHLIASSACCLSTHECKRTRTIVAAYSMNQNTPVKLLYVSTNLGDTFETKIIGSTLTPLNLIKGIYKVYSGLAEFYQALTKSDDNNSPNSKSQEVFQKLLRKAKEEEGWDAKTIEEKEAIVFAKLKVDTGSTSTDSVTTTTPRYNVFKENVSKTFDLTPKDHTPGWVTQFRDAQFIERFNKTEEQCLNDTDCVQDLEDDPIVDFLLSSEDSQILIKTPKNNAKSEPFCDEIVSMEVEQEEFGLTILCRVSVGNQTKTRSQSSLKEYYAVYSLIIKTSNPIVVLERKSNRIVRCKPVMAKSDPIEKDKRECKTTSNHREIIPDLIRVQGTNNYVIINCKHVIYYSTNGCRTLYNAVFYYKDKESVTVEKTKRQHILTGTEINLDSAPLAAVDPMANYITFTHGNYYLHGAFSYNRELRFIVGELLEKENLAENGTSGKTEMPSRVHFVPCYTNSGRLVFLTPLKTLYKGSNFYDQLYSNRYAIRLTEVPHSFYFDLSNFYDENRNANKNVGKNRNFLFKGCNTLTFRAAPKAVSLDLGDKATFEVSVIDKNPHLPLIILSSQERSLSVAASLKNSGKANTHQWEVEITALSTAKREEDTLIDAFFGSSYESIEPFSTNLVLVNNPSLRCHVQPSALITANIGCQHKILVAYEEEHRPQCEGQFYNFQYILKKNEYDPDMVKYWIEKTKDTFFEKQKNGDLLITYDYTTFGCPLQPYRIDNFAADLRLVDSDIGVNSTSPKYKGEYILIELFGAEGYTFQQTVSGVGCKQEPQTLKNMTEEWKIRRQAFRVISGMLSPKSVEKENHLGNKLFDVESVILQENIWNKANYRSCHRTENENDDKSSKFANEPYQIMKGTKVDIYEGDQVDQDEFDEEAENNEGTSSSDDSNDEDETDEEADDEDEDDAKLYNEIIWDNKKHQTLYIFLAIALDSSTSFCEFKTTFGVSLPPRHTSNDLVSVIVYLLFLLLWILIVMLGYVGRRAYIRRYFLQEARIDRLEEAAWTIIYRYERIIHEQAIKRKKKRRTSSYNE